MTNKNVLGIVFSSAYDDKLREMTNIRTMGSIPFAGRYRLIDFVLSNMVNCGITKVGIITKSNYQSLLDHLGSGKAWDLSRKTDGMTILPPFNLGSGGVYSSRIEALSNVMDYIKESRKDYVVMSDCNAVCNIDYDELLKAHEKSGADITLAYTNGVIPKIEDRMVLTMAEDGKVSDIAISPEAAEGNYALNITVISRMLLERLINDAKSQNFKSFEQDIIQDNVDSLKIYGYEVKDYVRVIDSLQSYYDISMGLVKGDYKKLFNKERPVYTKSRDHMPATYGVSSSVNNSLVGDGCIIKGKVENSIIFRGVTIEEGAEIKNSIVMQDTFISAGAKINCAILDKDVVVKPARELSGAPTYPIYIGKKILV